MCDCTSEDDSEPKVQSPKAPIDNDNLKSDRIKSCDCTSEDDSEPKIKTSKNTIAINNLQSNVMKSCDCTSEDDDDDDGKPKIKSCDCTSEDDDGKPKIKSCDCTSEDDSAGATKSCDCTSEDSSSERKKEIPCEDSDDRDNLKSPYAIVQVELSKSMLNLLPSSHSSTSCDCTSSTDESQDKSSCSSKEEASCDCTSESSQSSSSKSESGKDKTLEWTLAIIKPEALIFRREIERIMEEEGFSICQRRRLHLTAEQASEFYCDNDEQKDFARLVAYMSSKPIAVYVLCKLDAITEWRLLIGPSKVSDARIYAPDSIRAKYGRKGEDMQNAVHGSFDERTAEREIHFFFPDCIIEPLLRDEAAEEYLWKNLNDVLSEGLIKCCEAKPEEPLLWLANWLLDGKKPKYLLRSTSNLND